MMMIRMLFSINLDATTFEFDCIFLINTKIVIFSKSKKVYNSTVNPLKTDTQIRRTPL